MAKERTNSATDIVSCSLNTSPDHHKIAYAVVSITKGKPVKNHGQMKPAFL